MVRGWGGFVGDSMFKNVPMGAKIYLSPNKKEKKKDNCAC